jgi:hypothetical protein
MPSSRPSDISGGVLPAISLQTSIAASVVALVIAAALFQARPVAIPGFRTLPNKEAHEFYERAAEAEVEARRAAAGKFRGSPWSQDDEFHNREAKFIRAYSKAHNIPIGSLVDALDRGMHAGWPTPPNATPDPKVIPCRPRLSY